MIGWLLKKVTPASQPSPQRVEGAALVPAPDCAIWNDISRALDLSSRPWAENGRAKDDNPQAIPGGQADQ